MGRGKLGKGGFQVLPGFLVGLPGTCAAGWRDVGDRRAEVRWEMHPRLLAQGVYCGQRTVLGFWT